MMRLNDWLASHITDAVGTMWCAYAFAVLAIIGYQGNTPADFVRWFSTVFLQLTLLSVILVSQSRQNAAADRREALLLKLVEELCAEEGVCVPTELEGTDAGTEGDQLVHRRRDFPLDFHRHVGLLVLQLPDGDLIHEVNT